MSETAHPPETRKLIASLDRAVEHSDPQELCLWVKQALIDAVSTGKAFLPEKIIQPEKGRYARRLLHKDPAGRYSVVIMVWGPQQKTSIHDHAKSWCVECVYKGRIRVESFDLDVPEKSEELFQLRPVSDILSGKCEAGALIPPYEYHRISNMDQTPAVTIHVYCGEMTSFNAFKPVAGGYRPEKRETYYTS